MNREDSSKHGKYSPIPRSPGYRGFHSGDWLLICIQIWPTIFTEKCIAKNDASMRIQDKCFRQGGVRTECKYMVLLDQISVQINIEQVGDLWCEMDGAMEVGIAINADASHWRLDLEKNLLRRVAVIAGQSARFAIFACER